MGYIEREVAVAVGKIPGWGNCGDIWDNDYNSAAALRWKGIENSCLEGCVFFCYIIFIRYCIFIARLRETLWIFTMNLHHSNSVRELWSQFGSQSCTQITKISFTIWTVYSIFKLEKLPLLQNFISVLGDNELRRSSLASERYRLWWHPFSYDLDKTRENIHLQQACRETQKWNEGVIIVHSKELGCSHVYTCKGVS